MAYEEYKNSGRTGGKILYQLSRIGVPLHIVESVIIDQGKIKYGKEPFATYEWCVTNTPVFTFVCEYFDYNKKLKQPKLMNMDQLLLERENMMAGLAFYASTHEQYSRNPHSTYLVSDKGSVAYFCLGKEIPKDHLKFVNATLESFKWAL